MKITFLGDIMAEPPVLKAAKKKDGYDFRGVFSHTKKLLEQSQATMPENWMHLK